MPPQPLLPAGPPPSDELQSLLRMGFPRTAAEGALRRFRSLQLAADWLVDNAENGWAALGPGAGGAASGVAVDAPAAGPSGRTFGDSDFDLEPPTEEDVQLTEEEDGLLARALGLSLAELYPGETRSPRSASGPRTAEFSGREQGPSELG